MSTRIVCVMNVCVVIAWVALSAPACALEDEIVPVKQFLDGFNSGDRNAACAAFASGEIAIVDQVEQHVWIGPKAPQNWWADRKSHSKTAHISEEHYSYSKPSRSDVDSHHAYEVIPMVYRYKEFTMPLAVGQTSSAKQTQEEGMMTFALEKGLAGWKIVAWTWTGFQIPLQEP